MRGRTRPALAARLVVVVAVLAGLVFAHGMQCTDRMSAMVSEQVASSSMVVRTTQDRAVPPVMAEVADGDRSAGSHGLGGILTACLVCIVAVVAVIVGLRSSLVRIIVAVLMSARGRRVIPIIRPRASSLAELCPLRT